MGCKAGKLALPSLLLVLLSLVGILPDDAGSAYVNAADAPVATAQQFRPASDPDEGVTKQLVTAFELRRSKPSRLADLSAIVPEVPLAQRATPVVVFHRTPAPAARTLPPDHSARGPPQHISS
jgi:hypothetical protein